MIFALGALVLGLAGCSTVEERPAKMALEPMTRPQPYPVGTLLRGLENGKPFTWRVLALNGGAYTVEDTNGCKWTDIDIVAPPLYWENCSGSSGTIEVETEGSLWPLEVGKTVTYRLTGTNSKGNSWSGVRRCEAEDIVSLTTTTGDHDTYKVVCRDKTKTLTYYISPAFGDRVLFNIWSAKRGSTNTYEILEISF